MSTLCSHDDNYHLRLLLTGIVDSKYRTLEINDSVPLGSCVLDLFLTDKRFLSRDITDKLYYRFSALWLDCGAADRDVISLSFRRILMTRPFFIFLAYIYLAGCLCELSSVVRVTRLSCVCPADVEARVKSYPYDRLEALLNAANLQHMSDLHRHVFGTDLRIPVPNQTSSPCLPMLRAKEYDYESDVPVFCGNVWVRSDKLRSPESSDADSVEVRRLVAALRRGSGAVPSGNPMYMMAKALVERYCRREGRYLVPLGRRSLGDGLSRLPGMDDDGSAHRNGTSDGERAYQSERGDIGPTKISLFALSVSLRHGLISSVVDLPVFCYCKTKCERYAVSGGLSAVVCKNCGHCLNLGKERLDCGNGFPLNSMFYYRDKQEKSVIYSTHGGIAHCSLCGSQYLISLPVYTAKRVTVGNFSTDVVLWTAVTGSNSACAVYGRGSCLDVIVPCSSRTCYSTVVLRRVGQERVMRLVSHGNDFMCQLCQSAYRETCLDEDGRGPLCLGCQIYKNSHCHQNRNADDISHPLDGRAWEFGDDPGKKGGRKKEECGN